jgi:hypothetical protein
VVSIIMLLVALGTGGLMLRSALKPVDNGGPADEHAVRRGSFEVSVPASGELAAKEQIEIRNKLDYRAVITQVIDEGEIVKTKLITAQSNLETRLITIQAESEKADLNVTLAELALRVWEEGEHVSRQKQLDLAIETAEINHRRLVDRYEESKELVKQEFISQDEFKRDEIAMIEANARLEQAKLDKRIYVEYEYERDQKQKASDVEQALAERNRIEKRHEAEALTARRGVESAQHDLQSREVRLADLEEQLELCTVLAPSDGLVVYAGSLEDHRWSRMNRGELQAGTEVRKNELLMILPDTSTMTAEVKVSESLTGLIEPGQRARRVRWVAGPQPPRLHRHHPAHRRQRPGTEALHALQIRHLRRPRGRCHPRPDSGGLPRRTRSVRVRAPGRRIRPAAGAPRRGLRPACGDHRRPCGR